MELKELKENIKNQLINNITDVINDRCEAELGQVHAVSRGGKVMKTTDTKLIAKDVVNTLLDDNYVMITKEEYDNLKFAEKHYDPFWFCAFGGCEGACCECKDDCEMSLFVKEKQKRTYEILKWMEDKVSDYNLWIDRMNMSEANKTRVRCVLESFVAEFENDYVKDISSQRAREKCNETLDR